MNFEGLNFFEKISKKSHKYIHVPPYIRYQHQNRGCLVYDNNEINNNFF